MRNNKMMYNKYDKDTFISTFRKSMPMRNLVWLVLVLCSSCGLSSCEKISGQGPVVTEVRTINNFTGINTSIEGDVYVYQDSVYKVELLAQQNILDAIESSVDNGVLNIGFKSSVRIGPHDRIKVYITMPAVRSLAVSGSGLLSALQPIEADDVELKIAGSGNISLSSLAGNKVSGTIAGSGNITVLDGSAYSEQININGSGLLDLAGIASQNADVNLSGSGASKVNIQKVLNASISGSGTIYYTGNGQINSNVSGSGKVVKM
ncbi:head GIN domain-containing protein [Taibaiella soli]|uniref:Putative auto-transporter adhesin head GIN domain-containing protein n=1 Tax=Taibaiella soli TaxID=1649169 RepID=A0A2W2BDR9_9BACT|nr:head GIN domain-containing protein [Taibaiella soli]PZF74027.1 hypothetical protein DN068_04845 [Taibaiella soli]